MDMENKEHSSTDSLVAVNERSKKLGAVASGVTGSEGLVSLRLPRFIQSSKKLKAGRSNGSLKLDAVSFSLYVERISLCEAECFVYGDVFNKRGEKHGNHDC